VNSGYYKRVSRQAKELSRLDNDNVLGNDVDNDGAVVEVIFVENLNFWSDFGASNPDSRGRFS